MRNYIPKTKNPAFLPHDLYMQMFYLIRDYQKNKKERCTLARKKQLEAVDITSLYLKDEYAKRPAVYGELNPLRAFFDYPYYSTMYAQKDSDMGAGKRSWSLYRSRFAHHVATKLHLV